MTTVFERNSSLRKRRKTLRNSVVKAPSLAITAESAAQAFEEAGIDASRRPETLSLDEFAALARALQDRGARFPRRRDGEPEESL